MSTLVLTDSQKVSLSIAPVDAAGQPAPVDGVPAWASSDDTVLTVAASSDGLACDAVTTGKLGTATVSVTADADMGAGSTEIVGTLDIQVNAGPAVSLGITAGEPSER